MNTNHLDARRLVCACAVAAVAAVAGCQRADTRPPGGEGIAPIPAANVRPPPGNGSGVIGAFGYQTHFLDRGRTGNGALNTVGITARGGGPVDLHPGVTPYGLAPNEHIGSPVSDGTERVVVDPATGRTMLWSQSASAARHRLVR